MQAVAMCFERVKMSQAIFPFKRNKSAETPRRYNNNYVKDRLWSIGTSDVVE